MSRRTDFLKAAEYAERADYDLDRAAEYDSEGKLDLAHGYRLSAAGWHRAELTALGGDA